MPGRRRTVEICLALVAVALLAGAWVADQRWFDRHFLPSFFVTRGDYLRIEMTVRIVAIVAAVLLGFVFRRRIARPIADHPGTAIAAMAAVVIAFGAAEAILRQKRMRAAEEVPPHKEPLRYLDARLGWLFVPSHVGYQSNNGRRVQYVTDENGYRVHDPGDRIDFDAPTIVFGGESMMVGEKLLWNETLPARVSARLGIQSANTAVSGYATDQAYLRLRSELPRFRQPVAVVTLFTPSIFDRNLDDDRPHLDANMELLPPAQHWRLVALARRIIRYRNDEAIDRGIATTREVLRATVQLAESRGAIALIVVPQFLPESPRERELRRRILDEANLPYVFVPLNSALRVPDDGHPNAEATRLVADAVTSRLVAVLDHGTRYASRGLHEKNPTAAVPRCDVGMQPRAGSIASTAGGGGE